MEKGKYESEYLKSLGKQFLDNTFIQQKTQEQLENEFRESLKSFSKEEAEKIFEKYTRLADLLRYTFTLYYNNINFFEKQVLQANSIISTSLMLEYRVNDIVLSQETSNDLVLYSENTLKKLKKIREAELNKLELPLVKELNEKDRALIKRQVYSVLQDVEQMLNNTQKYIEDARKQIAEDKRTLKEAKKDEYFIGNLSKEKEFKKLFKSILVTYISNDIIERYKRIIYKRV